jgi:hypothetical protein
VAPTEGQNRVCSALVGKSRRLAALPASIVDDMHGH